MAFLQGSLNVTGGFTVSSPVFANLFKDSVIEDVSSLLNFLSLLGLQVLSSRRMPSVPFLSLCRLPLPCPLLSLSSTCTFPVPPAVFQNNFIFQVGLLPTNSSPFSTFYLHIVLNRVFSEILTCSSNSESKLHSRENLVLKYW